MTSVMKKVWEVVIDVSTYPLFATAPSESLLAGLTTFMISLSSPLISPTPSFLIHVSTYPLFAI